MSNTWHHFKTIVEGEVLELSGLNLWDHDWKATEKTISINDPIYKQSYTFNVYEIHAKELTVTFAAGEFSNNVWGIYVQQNFQL